MSKEIKDYLHLYLGCEVKFDNDKYLGNPEKLTIDVLHNIDYGNLYNNVKLTLRHLSDMTEEEAGWIWQYAFESGLTTQLGNVFSYDISKIEDNKKVVSINIHRLDRPHHCVNIRTSDGGTIVFNDEDVTKKPEFLWRPEHSSILFTYLLSKHFDIFNLIESGVAIDKKTLK